MTAFEAVYDRHHRAILSFCRHMLGHPEEAEDAVQHTFLAAYNDLIGSEKPIQLRAWLFTIARNRCYSVLRARREQPSERLVESATEGLAVQVQRRQDLRDLVVDMRRLPDNQRAALVLAELDALTHEEISDVLGVPREKVKALVFQARESLVASRTARETDCSEIREQLTSLRGAGLRRANIRRHLRECSGCRDFRHEADRQRKRLAIVLPVAPTVAVKNAVLSGVVGGGAGIGATGGGALASSALKASLLKGLLGAALAGIGTAGTIAAVHELREPSRIGAHKLRSRSPAPVRPGASGSAKASSNFTFNGSVSYTKPSVGAVAAERGAAGGQTTTASSAQTSRVTGGAAVYPVGAVQMSDPIRHRNGSGSGHPGGGAAPVTAPVEPVLPAPTSPASGPVPTETVSVAPASGTPTSVSATPHGGGPGVGYVIQGGSSSSTSGGGLSDGGDYGAQSGFRRGAQSGSPGGTSRGFGGYGYGYGSGGGYSGSGTGYGGGSSGSYGVGRVDNGGGGGGTGYGGQSAGQSSSAQSNTGQADTVQSGSTEGTGSSTTAGSAGSGNSSGDSGSVPGSASGNQGAADTVAAPVGGGAPGTVARPVGDGATNTVARPVGEGGTDTPASQSQ